MQFRQSTHLLTENIIYSYSDGRKARIKLAENLFHNVKSHSSQFRLPSPLQLQNKNTGEILADIKLMPKYPVTSAESEFHSRYFKVQLYQAELVDHQWEWVHTSPQSPLQSPAALTALAPDLPKGHPRLWSASHSSSF